MSKSDIRKGRVSSINYDTGMMRVTYRDRDRAVTAEYPILNLNDEYRMPEIGQDVIVAHMSNGSSRGVVLGPVWNKKYKPKEGGKQLYRKDLSRKKDAAYIRYDDATGEYLLKAATVHINGVHETTLDGPRLTVAANLSAEFEAPEMSIVSQELIIGGERKGRMSIDQKADIDMNGAKKYFKALLLRYGLETVGELLLKAREELKLNSDGAAFLDAAENLWVNAGQDISISAGGKLEFSDGENSISLKEIVDKLQSLGGGG